MQLCWMLVMQEMQPDELNNTSGGWFKFVSLTEESIYPMLKGLTME